MKYDLCSFREYQPKYVKGSREYDHPFIEQVRLAVVYVGFNSTGILNEISSVIAARTTSQVWQ